MSVCANPYYHAFPLRQGVLSYWTAHVIDCIPITADGQTAVVVAVQIQRISAVPQGFIDRPSFMQHSASNHIIASDSRNIGLPADGAWMRLPFIPEPCQSCARQWLPPDRIRQMKEMPGWRSPAAGLKIVFNIDFLIWNNLRQRIAWNRRRICKYIQLVDALCDQFLVVVKVAFSKQGQDKIPRCRSRTICADATSRVLNDPCCVQYQVLGDCHSILQRTL